MPVKGFLMVFVMAAILAFIYREPLSKWFDDICDEDSDFDDKE